MKLIYNAVIYTMESDPIDKGYISFENGLITEICAGDPPKSLIESCEEVTDAQGGIVMPGLIDAHTHIGGIGDGLGFESDDINEITDPVSPNLSALDCINPMDRCFEDARNSGITTVCTGPGSANPIAGTFITIKTYGKRIENMIVQSPASMKMAFGENPKTCYHENEQAPETRMSIAALIREALNKAVRYQKDLDRCLTDEDASEPDYDAKNEALLPCVRKELPVHFHAHRADDIFTAIRIAKEFDLKYSIVHCTEGHLIADELKKENTSVMIGPIICDRSKPEVRNQSIDNARILAENGVKFAIISDHPEVPCQYLMTSAAFAVKSGLDKMTALKALTIFPAEILGLEDKIGSLRGGKDADIVIFDRDPMDVFARVKALYINGEKRSK